MKIEMKSKFFKLLMAILVLTVIIAGQVFAATNDFEVGTQNLNNTAQNSAKVSDILNKPEKEWKRYDDTNSKLTFTDISGGGYSGRFNNSASYKDTYTQFTKGSLKFKFNKDKIRIIGFKGAAGYSKDVKVKIDGKEAGSFSNFESTGSYTHNVLLFEINNLQDTYHTIEIYNSTGEVGTYVNITAIDISEDGEIMEYEAVEEGIKVSSLELNKNALDLIVGQDETLTATVKPDDANNKSIKWTSSDSSIATVDSNGKVIGVKPGKATITATAQDGSNLSKTCEVNVKDIEIDQGNAVLKVEMVTNDVYEYQLPITEINKFIAWMDSRAKGEGSPYYKFSKNPNITNIESRAEYLMYNQVVNFTVDKYK